MKILLIVEREPGTDDCAWVAEAADEFTLGEWNGALPDPLQRVLDRNPANTRKLWVEIPDDSFAKLWDAPTVAGSVTAPDVDALEAARAAATPGPWATDGACVVPGYWGDTPPILARTNDYPDAALIVAAVNNLDELLAAARERDALRVAVEAVAEWCEKQAGSRSHFAKVDPGYRDTVIPYEAAAERIRAALATQAGDVR